MLMQTNAGGHNDNSTKSCVNTAEYISTDSTGNVLL
jgi:hypothetical protein